RLRILNWTAYIDPSEGGATGTVERFETATGIDIEYSEDLNDNEEVFKHVFESLGSGTAPEYDIACPTNWMAARLKRLGLIEPLPLDLIRNAANLDPRLRDVAWDPGAGFNLPWQVGITGIAFNLAKAGRALSSINDLFDPAFAGEVALFTDMRDTVGLVMLGMGADPSIVDEVGMTAALDKIEGAVSSGQIRSFAGNEYIDGLNNGNLVACVAWSGDIAAAVTNPDVVFIVPAEGGMLWYDTMVVLKGSPNVESAASWMNFVYDPVQAAQITAYVQYVSPVVGVRDQLVALGGDAAVLADSPYLFPSDEVAPLKVFADMPDDLEAAMTQE
ncbi:unnamed protein product, partial [Phaeothamnion confervicola]